MFGVGETVTVRSDVSSSEGLNGARCRVTGVQGELRDVRRIDPSTGQLTGIEVRFLVSELQPAE